MKKGYFLAVLLVLSFVLAACTEGTAGDSESASDAKGEDGKQKDSIVIGFESDAATLIANSDVNYVTDAQIRSIYDPLIDRDGDTGEFVPVLAEEWENIDELTWRLKLKEGVKFHNGSDFNAEAAKFSIDYILDDANQSFYKSRWSDIKEVKVLSDYEVEIITSKPFPSLIERIADDLLIMDPVYVNDVGTEEASKKPVGTGPYEFVEWSRDNYLKLKAFEDYWAGPAKIKNVEFRYIPEFSTRLSAFVSGEIDMFKNVPVDSVEKIESDENSKIAETASARINYLALSTFSDGPMKDVKVRQAMNHAIDVDELLEAVLNGHGTKLTGPLSKINSGYTETDAYEYDPEKAKELLKEAGYDPESMELTLDTPNGRYPMDSQVAQAIAAQLQRIGITVNVQVNEWGAHLEKVRNREIKDMFILGWGPAFDAQSTIENLFTEAGPYSSFSEPGLEKKIYETNEMFDQDERYDGYAEIQKALVEQAAWVPLWQQSDMYAVRKDLDFKPKVDEKILPYEMSWEN
ncbi:ABC transporter substrate-binding protein [Edaphobacillus lindanitolerans]|uniref:Peptide/nickel transport system substrate-binding protein n=1 Tax=Edaphobacillus lindanitolerans TaxID=550447 RepID=A0A1U7PN54_9BACI|nr:ABC transporter substrate-binding protein [Edaphobacillus lindanitolerans]SIT72046.1 peptide/nickel transport system substrate-binding protein [Edaphobacillus lindanitolerans]